MIEFQENIILCIFLKSHAKELSQILQILRQDSILQSLIDLDPSNRDIYEEGLK